MRRLTMLVLLLLLPAVAWSGAAGEPLARAARGEFDGPAMVQVEGFYRGESRAVTVFSSGVGIADGKRQFPVSATTVRKVFSLLLEAKFEKMPEQFGGKPKPTHKPELRSFVGVRVGAWQKTVVQMRDGEQSPGFAKLVERLFKALEQESRRGVTVLSFQDGLEKLQRGEIAPETLQLELAWEQSAGRFAVFTVQGPFVTFAPGNGTVNNGWLTREQARELVGILGKLDLGRGPSRFSWPKQVSLEAAILGHRSSLVGGRWSGTPSPDEEAAAARWGAVEESLQALAKGFFSEQGERR